MTEPEAGRRPGSTHRERILVLNVDDYEAGRYATSRILRQAGFDVREAATGHEALRLTASEHPDMVLLDVNLPDLNGFEVCRRIKSDPSTGSIPVLYLSAAYRGPEHRVQGLDLGADGYLTQPVEARELVATVNALLRARQVEEAVRDSEERFRSLVAATSQIVWRTPPGGALEEEQPGWSAFTGQSGEEQRGWGWLDAVHPDDRARTAALWRAALERRAPYEVEHRLRRADGEWRHMQVRAVPVLRRDGEVREWVGADTDVTEKRRAEDAQWFLGEASRVLASSLEHERALEDLGALAVPRVTDLFAVHLLDDEGRWEWSTARGLGGPTDASAALPAAAEAVRRGAPVRVPPEDVPGNGPAAVAVPLRARGRVLGALTLALTEAGRRLDDADAALAADLAGRVALAVEGARSYRDAVQANAAKSQFLAVMSHELRTPLNAIIGYADLLDAEVAGTLLPAQREQLGRIRVGSKHLLALIEEILLFSRMEAGMEEARPERVDLADVVREAAALVEPLARQKELGFRLDLPEQGMPVETDPGKVHQIVLNLLSNAVKFSDRGGIGVSVRGDGDAAVIEVSDDGIGISPDHLERVFEPFSQVEQAPTRRVGGTGLGLSVTRDLARLLGGEVEVHSTVGKGSVFQVRIPRLSAPA